MAINLKKDLNKLVAPIFVETLLTMLLGGIDTFMLSQYSDEAVAAVGMDNQILMLVFLLFTIINAGTIVLCSQYLGAGRQDKFIRVGFVALLLNLLVGLIVSVILYFGAEGILGFMGIRPELMVYGKTYLQIVGGFAFTQAITTTVNTILRSADKPIYPMMVIAIVNVINIIGNYTLIFGKFGMPALGSDGAAISTSLSRVISMIVICIILRKKLFTKIPDKLFKCFPSHELRDLLKIGLPSAGENISYNLQQMTLLYFINAISNEALTARTYIVNIVMFVYLYAICIAQGNSILIGHLIGDNKTKAAYTLGKFAWHRGAMVSVTFSLIVVKSGGYLCLWENIIIPLMIKEEL